MVARRRRAPAPPYWSSDPRRRPAIVYETLGRTWATFDELMAKLGGVKKPALQETLAKLANGRLIEQKAVGGVIRYRQAEVEKRVRAAAARRAREPRRDRPATKGQRMELRRLGAEVPDDITHADAAERIVELWRNGGFNG